MGMVLIVLAIVFGLVQLGCSIVIYIHAFKSSVGEGFLCLCVPCYIIYYMFSKFEHPKKGLIIGLWWAGLVISLICNFAGQSLMAPSYSSNPYGGY